MRSTTTIAEGLLNTLVARTLSEHVCYGNMRWLTRLRCSSLCFCGVSSCPIIGQLEISAHQTGVQDANALWVVDDGIFFPVVRPGDEE
jgi:hypothetical protein